MCNMKKICFSLVLAAVFALAAVTAHAGQSGMMHGNMHGSSSPEGMHNSHWPIMRDGNMDMAVMRGMMGRMMNDAQGGRMMGGALTGCMTQSAMNEYMRRNKAFSDKAFLSAMIPHHEGAVEMARDVLKNGKDAQVKKWAEAVVADQEGEIKEMREWLTGMGGEDAQAAAAMKNSMQYMMQAPMSQDPDVNFVAMMIGHHAGAVEMAVGAVMASTDERVIKLANNMAQAQLNEIIAYRAWLKANGH